jgi:hypothetical protein
MGYEIWGAKEISKKKQKYRRKQRKREIELHRLTGRKTKREESLYRRKDGLKGKYKGSNVIEQTYRTKIKHIRQRKYIDTQMDKENDKGRNTHRKTYRENFRQ